MRPQAQRLLIFLALCFAFGAIVWMAEIEQPAVAGQLAQSLAAQTSSGQSEGSGQDILCGPGQLVQVIIEAERKGGGIGSDATAKAVIRKETTKPYKKWMCKEEVKVGEQPPTCQVWRCCDPRGNCAGQCPADNPTISPEGFSEYCRRGVYCPKAPWYDPDCIKDRLLGSVNPAALLAQAVLAQGAPTGSGQTRCPTGNCAAEALRGGQTPGQGNRPPLETGQRPGPSNPPKPTPSSGNTGISGGDVVPLKPPTAPTTQQPGSAAPAVPTAGPAGPSAGNQISDIANRPSGGSQIGSTDRPQPTTFNPSQQISNPFNWGTASFGGGSGGYSVPSGGSVAYAPSGPTGFYNRNFESLGGPSTFSQSQVSPYDLVARLAANTPRPGSQVTADELSGGVTRGGLGRTLLGIGSAIFSPVGEFLSSALSPASSEPDRLASLSEREVTLAPKRVSFDKRLLEVGVAELLLIPGDPREVFERIEGIAEGRPTRPSNPFFDGVLVRTNPWEPGAGGLMGYIALDSGEGGGSTEETSPQVSPSEGGEGMQDAIRGALEGSKPRNAFSAMRLTLGTIADALSNLFKNFFTTLFWWL